MLRNPAGLYSGGQGIFDSTPYRVAYEKAQYIKAAKEEALNKHFSELPKSLNAAGVRDQDRHIIDGSVDKMKRYFMENKDSILKGGQARYEYEKMIQNAGGVIDRSKQLGKKELELGKMKFTGANSHIFEDASIVENMRRLNLPLDNPEHQDFDLYTATLPPKPFDAAKNQRNLNLLYKPDDMEIVVTNDPTNSLYDIETKIPKFTKESLNGIRVKTLNDIESDRSFKAFIQKQRTNPTVDAQLAATFKKIYGEEMQTDADAAAAYQYLQLVPPPKKVDRKVDQKASKDYSESLYARRPKTSSSASAADTQNLNRVFAGILNVAKTPDIGPKGSSKRVASRVNRLDADAQRVIFSMVPDKDVNSNNTVLTFENGNVKLYRLDPVSGQPVLDAAHLVASLSEIGIDLGVQPNAKSKAGVVAEGNKKKAGGTTAPSAPSKTKSIAEQMKEARKNK